MRVCIFGIIFAYIFLIVLQINLGDFLQLLNLQRGKIFTLVLIKFVKRKNETILCEVLYNLKYLFVGLCLSGFG